MAKPRKNVPRKRHEDSHVNSSITKRRKVNSGNSRRIAALNRPRGVSKCKPMKNVTILAEKNAKRKRHEDSHVNSSITKRRKVNSGNSKRIAALNRPRGVSKFNPLKNIAILAEKNAKRKRHEDSHANSSITTLTKVNSGDSRHIAALILARGGSKGIPLKNIKMLAGVPLIGWVIRAALDSGVFDSVWVSTDHDDIAKVASAWGAKVHRRSQRVSKDCTSSLETIQEFSIKHPEVEVICNIQATSPCLHPKHLKEALKLMTEQRCDSVFSVVRRHHFRWKEVKKGVDNDSGFSSMSEYTSTDSGFIERYSFNSVTPQKDSNTIGESAVMSSNRPGGFSGTPAQLNVVTPTSGLKGGRGVDNDSGFSSMSEYTSTDCGFIERYSFNSVTPQKDSNMIGECAVMSSNGPGGFSGTPAQLNVVTPTSGLKGGRGVDNDSGFSSMSEYTSTDSGFKERYSFNSVTPQKDSKMTGKSAVMSSNRPGGFSGTPAQLNVVTPTSGLKGGRGNCTQPLNLNPACRPRRQDWDGELCENGSFYFATKELVANGLLQGGNTSYFEMCPECSVDIDVDIDWPVAEQRVLRYGYFGKDKPEVVKLLLCNVSGCLTDGQIYISANGEDMVSFNTRDQAGINMLMKEGVKVILIEQNTITKPLAAKISKRMGCQVLQNVGDKLKRVEKLMKKDRLEWKEVAYMGNDEPDVNCLNLAGLSAVPLDAPVVALNAAKYSCHCAAGRGAVREFAEHILLLKKKAKSQMEQDRIC